MNKGILLAGGSGTRLFPATISICKQLLPIYDKPMIYYALSSLMFAGIREILIISTPEDIPRFQKLFGDGSHLGLSFSYKVQENPQGIAQAFILGEDFIQNSPVALVLGDNLFYGHEFPSILKKCAHLKIGGKIFGYHVKEPHRYGVVEFDQNFSVLSIEEKPQHPKSPFAVPGIYFYDHQVVEIAKSLTPSKRGELEITDINNIYLRKGELQVEILGRGCAWLDTGTHEDLSKASAFVQAIQERQGVQIGCIEEIAYRLGYIDRSQLKKLAESYPNNGYAQYLLHLAMGNW